MSKNGTGMDVPPVSPVRLSALGFEKSVVEKVATMCCVDASCLCNPRTIAASGYGISGFKDTVQWCLTYLQ